MHIYKSLSATWICALLCVGACSHSDSDFAEDLKQVTNLDYKTRDSLLLVVQRMNRRILEESSSGRRESMVKALITQVITIEFSAPTPLNTPVASIVNYSEFLKNAAEILKDSIPPEKTLEMFLCGLERFDLEISRVDEWTRRCFPSPEDWGLPPETEEIVACLKSGDTNGIHASPRTQKILRSMTPDLRNRFPEIVSETMNSKSGGSRAFNYKCTMMDERNRLVQTICRKFMNKWSVSLKPMEYENLSRRFKEATGCPAPRAKISLDRRN